MARALCTRNYAKRGYHEYRFAECSVRQDQLLAGEGLFTMVLLVLESELDWSWCWMAVSGSLCRLGMDADSVPLVWEAGVADPGPSLGSHA